MILESRMREIRPSGLGGGVEGNTFTPTLYLHFFAHPERDGFAAR